MGFLTVDVLAGAVAHFGHLLAEGFEFFLGFGDFDVEGFDAGVELRLVSIVNIAWLQGERTPVIAPSRVGLGAVLFAPNSLFMVPVAAR